MKRMELGGTWKGRGTAPNGEEICFDGQVPGCVHTDLLRIGAIDDPMRGKNAEQCSWIEHTDWTYTRTFALDETPDERAYLAFDGLDTYADIYLNGKPVGQAQDMFIPHRFLVGGIAAAGENELRVMLHAPERYTDGRPRRDAAFDSMRMYTRRMQCTYGWDWVVRLVTMGIFRSCRLVQPGAAEIISLYAYTVQADEETAQIGIEAELTVHAPGAWLDLTLNAPDGRVVWQKRRRIVEPFLREKIDLRRPQLWYPAGYGPQPLYRLHAVLDDGESVWEQEMNVGIRTLLIRELPDEPGGAEEQMSLALRAVWQNGEDADQHADDNTTSSGFTLVINGVPIMAKGANWVPCEPFPSAETPKKQTELLTLAREGGANMLRVWGGGLFETAHFYDECDRLGLLVMQDHMMACGNYPDDDEAFLDAIRAEGEHVVRALRSHPCLAFWSGDNEDMMDTTEDDPAHWGRRAVQGVLAPLTRRLDPYRCYFPSSPYGGVPFGSLTVGTSHGTRFLGAMLRHIRSTDCTDTDECFFRYISRFCTEYPMLGATSRPSLRRFLSDRDIDGDDLDVWRFHHRNHPAKEFAEVQLFDYFRQFSDKLIGAPRDAADRLCRWGYFGYELARRSMEGYRRRRPFCSGLLYWMLNDQWAASSGWALIDYYALPKLAYYGMRRTAAPVIASIGRTADGFAVTVCSDVPHDVTGTLRLIRCRMASGEVTVLREAAFSVPAGQSAVALTAPADILDGCAPEDTVLLCDLSTPEHRDRAVWMDSVPAALRLPKTRVDVRERTENNIVLRAESYTHAVVLEGEYVFSDNGFILLPDEEKTVTFRPALVHEEDTITVGWLGKTKEEQT